VATREDKVERIAVHGNRLYALTYAEAPNYRIVSFDARSGVLAGATTFVPESSLVLTDFAGARDAMYVVTLDRGVHRLFRIGWQTAVREEVALPFEGSIRELVADPNRRGLIFSMEAWAQRQAWYQFLPGTGVRELPIMDLSTAAEDLLVERATVESDGVQVPLSIIRGRGTTLNGSAPAVLSGYGAYGLIQSPTYNPLVLTWARRGGVYAICHVRGGGEGGKAWHLAGIKQGKENGVNDFVRCAEYLLKRKYTTSSRLTAFGGSAGGILIGGAITKRPELFTAAVIRVGQLNPLRKEVTEGGPANLEEYGDVSVEAEFRSLLASDPYHRIREGIDYPAVLLTTGLQDPRVSSWVPGKFAARLQATGRARPTLLRVERDDGHGFESTQTQREEEYADIYSFALWRSAIDIQSQER
jgi:prolyl oligopeptidase